MAWRLDRDNTVDFLDTCRSAVQDEQAYANFRNSNSFKLIVENSPLKSGLEYLDCIDKKFPWLLAYMNEFVTSDKIGNPQKHDIGDYEISPSTMRYIKTLGDLVHFFGQLGDKRIAEIGAGYGGLCKIIHDRYKPSSYQIFDLPEVKELQRKFLSEFNVHPNFSEEPGKYDLTIAMYSWSELDLQTQIKYAMNVLTQSENCYIMLNYDMEASGMILHLAFAGIADIHVQNMFYDENNTEYAPYNNFIIIKNNTRWPKK